MFAREREPPLAPVVGGPGYGAVGGLEHLEGGEAFFFANGAQEVAGEVPDLDEPLNRYCPN
ncbi:MAG: hypothetical protein AAFN13_06380 [Bacteroidota bacterium]